MLGEDTHEILHTLGRLPGTVEIGHGGLVGGSLLAAGVFQQVAAGDLLSTHDHGTSRATGLPAASCNYPCTQHHGYDGFDLGMFQSFLESRQVASGDMAGFMGDDALDLAGALAAHEQAGGEKDILSSGNEGIEGCFGDDIDRDRIRVEIGGVEDWRTPETDGSFNLFVADKRAGIAGKGDKRSHHAGKKDR